MLGYKVKFLNDITGVFVLTSLRIWLLPHTMSMRRDRTQTMSCIIFTCVISRSAINNVINIVCMLIRKGRETKFSSYVLDVTCSTRLSFFSLGLFPKFMGFSLFCLLPLSVLHLMDAVVAKKFCCIVEVPRELLGSVMSSIDCAWNAVF